MKTPTDINWHFSIYNIMIDSCLQLMSVDVSWHDGLFRWYFFNFIGKLKFRLSTWESYTINYWWDGVWMNNNIASSLVKSMWQCRYFWLEWFLWAHLYLRRNCLIPFILFVFIEYFSIWWGSLRFGESMVRFGEQVHGRNENRVLLIHEDFYIIVFQ